MTIPAVSAGAIIDPAWGNAVADQLNDLPLFVQSGSHVSAPDGNGSFTITFPEPFASPPIVVAQMLLNSTATAYDVFTRTVSATQVTMRQTANNASLTTAGTVHWIAIGARP